ncbi:MAG TPA: DUF4062 domain-containing protein [Planktothrix sp.]
MLPTSPNDLYWHCLVELKSGSRLDSTATVNDLTFAEIDAQVVQNWLSERPFAVRNVVVHDQDAVKTIRIVRTDAPITDLADAFEKSKWGHTLAPFDQNLLPFSDSTAAEYTNQLLFPISQTVSARKDSTSGTDHMDKKFQVFVSSTYEDLKQQRNAVYETLLRNNCIPCGMELFEAGNQSQWETITKAIDLCDYHIVIIAHRYGSLSTEAISYTEKEYRYALSQGIPVAALVIDKGADWPHDDIHRDSGTDKYERMQKLDDFKAFVAKDKMVRFWKNTGELQAACFGASKFLIDTCHRPGWVRGEILEHLKVDSSSAGATVSADADVSDEENRARQDILLGALDGSNGNRINVLRSNGRDAVSIGGGAYNDDEPQRLLYLHVLQTLTNETLVKHVGGIQYELTYSGLKLANDLRAKGVIRRMPKP